MGFGWYLATIDTETLQSASLKSLPARERERLRERSKLVFGNKDRLEVIAAIAQNADDLISGTDLELEIGMSQSRVRKQLVALAEAGLLTAFPRSGDVRRWYRRNDSPLWEFGLSLYEDWIG